ncbi:MAG: hypothetical protein U9N86_04570 [Bacteroidota bacterium]|nr:hypothetical protein [Bacteroidota bacterium]
MNPVFIFTLLLLWLPISASDASAQYLKSVAAETWSEPPDFHALELVSARYQIELWQPFGVSNLNGLEMGLSWWRKKTSRNLSYSLLSMPGYRSHCVAAAVGRYFQDNFFLGQEIGFGIHESGNSNPAQCFVYCKTSSCLRVSEALHIQMELSNWPDLFWPASDHLPDVCLDFCFRQEVNEQASAGLGFRIAADATSQLVVFCGYRISNQHELFAGLTLNTMGFGLGYGFERNGLIIRFLLEAGSVFGYAPYTSILWHQK